MNNTFRKTLIVGAAAISMGFSVSASASGSNQDTAIDQNKNIIKNTWGNCVRTKWQAGSDACAPKVAPKPVAAPTPPPAPPKPIVSKEERTIYFDFDDDTLTSSATAKLDSLANEIRKSDRVLKANIIGYADEIGKTDYNSELSARRANAVNNYLSKIVTIDTNVAEIRGLGETNSKTSCGDVKKHSEKVSCLAKDRRVEVEFEYQH